jgi:hypothetical protein
MQSTKKFTFSSRRPDGKARVSSNFPEEGLTNSRVSDDWTISIVIGCKTNLPWKKDDVTELD